MLQDDVVVAHAVIDVAPVGPQRFEAVDDRDCIGGPPPAREVPSGGRDWARPPPPKKPPLSGGATPPPPGPAGLLSRPSPAWTIYMSWPTSPSRTISSPPATTSSASPVTRRPACLAR